MNRTFGRLRLIFLGLFLFGAAGIAGYQWLYARPKAACEAQGRWWDAKNRACGIPVWLPDFTGRPAPAGVQRPVERMR
jgi:hypothetical protein